MLTNKTTKDNIVDMQPQFFSVCVYSVSRWWISQLAQADIFIKVFLVCQQTKQPLKLNIQRTESKYVYSTNTVEVSNISELAQNNILYIKQGVDVYAKHLIDRILLC